MTDPKSGQIGSEPVVLDEPTPPIPEFTPIPRSDTGPAPAAPDLWAEHMEPGETVLWQGAPVYDNRNAGPLARIVPMAMMLVGIWMFITGDVVLGIGGALFAVLAFRALRAKRKGAEPNRLYLLTDRAAYIAVRGALGTPVQRIPRKDWQNIHRTGRHVFFGIDYRYNDDGDRKRRKLGFTDLPDARAVEDIFRQLTTR